MMLYRYLPQGGESVPEPIASGTFDYPFVPRQAAMLDNDLVMVGRGRNVANTSDIDTVGHFSIANDGSSIEYKRPPQTSKIYQHSPSTGYRNFRTVYTNIEVFNGQPNAVIWMDVSQAGSWASSGKHRIPIQSTGGLGNEVNIDDIANNYPNYLSESCSVANSRVYSKRRQDRGIPLGGGTEGFTLFTDRDSPYIGKIIRKVIDIGNFSNGDYKHLVGYTDGGLNKWDLYLGFSAPQRFVSVNLPTELEVNIADVAIMMVGNVLIFVDGSRCYSFIYDGASGFTQQSLVTTSNVGARYIYPCFLSGGRVLMASDVKGNKKMLLFSPSTGFSSGPDTTFPLIQWAGVHKSGRVVGVNGKTVGIYQV